MEQNQIAMKTICKRLTAMAALLLAATNAAVGNGDPVAVFSSINRVANPEPLSISEICILHETVNISHADGYNCFDVTYKFRNGTDKDFPEIHYGFPIDYLVDDEKETYQFTNDYYSEDISETGWCDELIKDVRFTFNGKELPFHSAKESVREAGFEVEIYDDGQTAEADSIPYPGINRRWYYTQFAMPPHSEATFNVRYKVYAHAIASLYDAHSLYPRIKNENDEYIGNYPMVNRYLYYHFTILYDFTPARHFGGDKPYLSSLNIDLSNFDNPKIRSNGKDPDTRLERTYIKSASEIGPVNLSVYINPNLNREYVERIIKPLEVDTSRYSLNMKDDCMEIDFNEPLFVSDIACDIDTIQVKSILSTVTFADGRCESYRYILDSDYPDEKIKSPALLTITDILHDGMRFTEGEGFSNMTGDFGSDRFKIRKIKLQFSREATTSSRRPFCNIRVLDARFRRQ